MASMAAKLENMRMLLGRSTHGHALGPPAPPDPNPTNQGTSGQRGPAAHGLRKPTISLAGMPHDSSAHSRIPATS